ncbi:GNAT family N-acetyltransferase [Streptomyces cinnamoneus]|uniref:GNAT family N-acetyltransferase n=1 Tax=Streptomyces cinnamoneus TaxID=53446 RepID=A0A2G1XIV5_STRCJ|nr:GNAT family N-acetyltransferase [Streptomyces cinnamoneus]PHQ51166.1 GNAT family N-acetyltransferase [Streptomyces cinnamoneus]PPT13611.1 N-acetyltransferase [Streptomyces cinnamoneus]
MKPMDVQVRPGGEEDLDALTEIYNHYVRETAITFDVTPFTPEERRRWLLSYSQDGPYRLLVAREGGEGPEGRVLGYATSSPFRAKAAYRTSVEVSVYCAPAARGRGVGTLLYEALFAALEGEDVHRAYAGVTEPNPASARLHRRFGFAPVGTFREVGRKFGRYWDVTHYERPVGGVGAAPGGG